MPGEHVGAVVRSRPACGVRGGACWGAAGRPGGGRRRGRALGPRAGGRRSGPSVRSVFRPRRAWEGECRALSDLGAQKPLAARDGEGPGGQACWEAARSQGDGKAVLSCSGNGELNSQRTLCLKENIYFKSYRHKKGPWSLRAIEAKVPLFGGSSERARRAFWT